ncbi:hypothetical protein IDJ77_08700 [Mucilaginibacter sp. ZT4R22]|uniref:Uncharacterized protein n=1 Tax=Mucilaginibacter pankratovii TaxID=2772110 RepID=A0ABR7WNJ0_9SPHI|nr:hypothetical protein [Mucilaginibacter pankratovii]MBD1363884.1 hypothetical protein [Mucilaginibacter pankratovii]
MEKNPKIAPYYVRLASYRFKAIFLGKTKPVDAEIIQSMQRVLTLNQRDPNQMARLVDSVVLIKVGQRQVWMPIQRNLLPQLHKEVSKGQKITLYCAFLNEHTTKNQLFNNFLISEFVTE